MRQRFYKFLPVIVGGVVGLAIAASTSVHGRAVLPVYLHAAALVVGLVAAGMLVIAFTFPANVTIEPNMDAAPPDVALLLEAYRSLGFELSGPPLRVHIRPAGEVWVLANRELGCWGSVFATGTSPRVVGYDFNSTLEGDRGELTSVADPRSAVLPLRPTSSKQLLRGASPQELLAFHRQAHDYLARRGVRFADPGQVRSEDRVRASTARQRRIFLANPIGVTVLVIWRVQTRSTPYESPVADQKRTEAVIRRLQAQPGAFTSR